MHMCACMGYFDMFWGCFDMLCILLVSCLYFLGFLLDAPLDVMYFWCNPVQVHHIWCTLVAPYYTLLLLSSSYYYISNNKRPLTLKSMPPDGDENAKLNVPYIGFIGLLLLL